MERKIKNVEYNPASEMHGYKNVRFVENVSKGLRFVGFADEIARSEGSRAIDHNGWYTDDVFQDETYRGVVYQLPSHGKGGTCFVYGYADPNNDDCALLAFDVTGDKLEAAKQADRFAEIFAEHEREYQEAWHAGRRCDDLSRRLGKNGTILPIPSGDSPVLPSDGFPCRVSKIRHGKLRVRGNLARKSRFDPLASF